MNWKVAANGASHLITKRFLGPFWIRRRWLSKTQWLAASELEAIQLKLLQRLVRNCYSTVPYYRRLMDEQGIKVESIRKLEDIKQFPILTKKEVLQAGRLIVSTKYPKWLMRAACTGGTTGTPLEINRSLFSIGDEHAFVRRQWDWAGIDFSDRCAWIVAGRRIAATDQIKHPLYAYDPFMKELSLSVFHLSPNVARTYIEKMIQYKVMAIVGISSAVYFLARASADLGIKIKLKAALTTSETMTDQMRDVISKSFGCKVFDFYGSAERTCYIHTCEHGSYHVVPEYGLTELVPLDSNDKNICKIIATGFWNRGMPLIRYATDDVVIKSDGAACECGREFPVVKSIIGRQSDLIRTPSGREYGPTVIARVLKGIDNILAVQIVQDSLDHICIQYVPGKQFSEKDIDHFEKHLSHYMPNELRIELVRVDAIEKTSSGKTKLIVSEI